ncbi:MAG TPA: 50S ribosomal protein L11 methyltransferase [Abditibacteriaceae bacterium]
MNQWVEVLVKVASEHSELGAQVLLENGCDGAQIDDTSVVLDESEDATLAPRAIAEIRSYLAPGADAEAVVVQVREALAGYGVEAEVSTRAIADEDWSTSWQQNFPPLHIGPFLIVPSWEEVPENGAIPIRLDPGLAFGTGQHPTTHMCLELLGEHLGAASKDEEVQKSNRKITVFDVGCGSGILSIAAAKLGAEVTGSDLDPFCTEATEENARVNNVQVKVVQEAGVDWIDEKFDLVVANLMSALLIQLAPQLSLAAKPGATLIVSGISSPRADDVEAALHAAGFSTLEKRERDGDHRGDFLEQWTAFKMRK